MKTPQDFFKSISLLWVGSIVGAGFSLLTQVILARGLGPKNFGEFASLFTVITIFTPLAGFGVHSLMLKVYGKEGWSAKQWLKPIFQYSFITSLGASLLIFGLASSDLYATSDRISLLLLLPVIASQAATNLVSSKLQLEQRYSALSFWQLAVPTGRLLTAVLLFYFLKDRVSIILLSFFFCVLALGFLIISFLSLKKIETPSFKLQGHPLPIDSSKPSIALGLKEVAQGSWGFGLSGLLYLIYYQSDIILLEYFAGGEVAGIYNVAYLVVGATYLLPGVIFQKYLLPQLHRWASKDLFKLAEVYKKGTFAMILLGCLSAACVFFFAPYFIPLIFGSAYSGSIAVLMILIICIPLRFFSSSADAVLTSGKQLNKKVKTQAFVALFNLILNLTFIPGYGIWAAAYITVLSELAMSFFMHYHAYKYLKPQINHKFYN